MTDNIQEEIEDKIIDSIALGAGGRLVAFKPENSDKDLVVEKKGDYKKKEIFFKIYGKEFSDKHDFEKEIRELINGIKINSEKGFYLIFVRFDIIKQDIGDKFLVVPSSDFKNFSEGNDFIKFLINKKDFVRFLIELFNKK